MGSLGHEWVGKATSGFTLRVFSTDCRTAFVRTLETERPQTARGENQGDPSADSPKWMKSCFMACFKLASCAGLRQEGTRATPENSAAQEIWFISLFSPCLLNVCRAVHLGGCRGGPPLLGAPSLMGATVGSALQCGMQGAGQSWEGEPEGRQVSPRSRWGGGD